MKYIEQGTPAFEGFINGHDQPTRVFVDNVGDLWFEVKPDLFVYDFFQKLSYALEYHDRFGDAVGMPLSRLTEDYPEGFVRTVQASER